MKCPKCGRTMKKKFSSAQGDYINGLPSTDPYIPDWFVCIYDGTKVTDNIPFTNTRTTNSLKARTK